MYGFTSSAVIVCRANGGGTVGYGCVGHACSPGMLLFGTGRSSIGPQRFAGDAIEHEEETLLGGLCDGVDRLAVVANRDQLWRGIVVVVPQIVVHHLKMPQRLSGACIQREQAVAEQVAADAIGAVVVIGGRAGGEVGDAALFVDRDLAPRVGAARIFPRVLRPRVVALFAGTRNGVEGPHQSCRF